MRTMCISSRAPVGLAIALGLAFLVSGCDSGAVRRLKPSLLKGTYSRSSLNRTRRNLKKRRERGPLKRKSSSRGLDCHFPGCHLDRNHRCLVSLWVSPVYSGC